MSCDDPASDGLLLPLPAPPPPSVIQPSLATVLQQCGLRYAWLVSRAPALLPTRPSVRLGTAVHELLSQVGSGRVPSDTGSMREAWIAIVSRTESYMRLRWTERSFVPLTKAIFNFEERRLKAFATARKVASALPNPARPLPAGVLLPEKTLVAENGVLTGKLDAVVATNKGIVIRDYKTGRVFEEGDDETVKQAYQVQLRLYALLYQRTLGRWPDALELIDAPGNVVEVPFTPLECEKLFLSLSKSLSSLARQIAQLGSDNADIAFLASPGEACKWCQFRPSCPAYRVEIERSPPPEVSGDVDIYGVLLGQTSGHQGLVTLDVQQIGGRTTISHLDPSGFRNPALSLLSPGDRVAIFDARRHASQAIRSTANTVVFKVRCD